MIILSAPWTDRSGAVAAEYALILGVLGAAIAVAALALGGSIESSMSDMADCITTPSGC